MTHGAALALQEPVGIGEGRALKEGERGVGAGDADLRKGGGADAGGRAAVVQAFAVVGAGLTKQVEGRAGDKTWRRGKVVEPAVDGRIAEERGGEEEQPVHGANVAGRAVTASRPEIIQRSFSGDSGRVGPSGRSLVPSRHGSGGNGGLDMTTLPYLGFHGFFERIARHRTARKAERALQRDIDRLDSLSPHLLSDIGVDGPGRRPDPRLPPYTGRGVA